MCNAYSQNRLKLRLSNRAQGPLKGWLCMDKATACVCEHTFLKGKSYWFPREFKTLHLSFLTIDKRTQTDPFLFGEPPHWAVRSQGSLLHTVPFYTEWSSSNFSHRRNRTPQFLSLKMIGKCSVLRPTGSQQGCRVANSEGGMATQCLCLCRITSGYGGAILCQQRHPVSMEIAEGSVTPTLWRLHLNSVS